MKNAATTKEIKKTSAVKTDETVQLTENSTMEELIAMLKEQQAEIEALKKAKTGKASASSGSAEKEKVCFLWQAEVSDDNVVEFGQNGMYARITGKTGSFYIAKDELSRIMDSRTRYFIDQRWLIILSGLNEEEKEAYGVNYSEGEILDKKAFAKMLDLGDKLIEIYPKLCTGHREIVAKRLYEAWSAGDKRISREMIVELNNLSKELGNEKGDFYGLLLGMNEKDIQQ